mgnify:CR=1 FL=1
MVPNPVNALAASLLLALPAGLAAQTFAGPPERLTDSTANFRLSRNPGGSLAFDATRDVLHLVYWQGGLETQLATPSAIFHREWTPVGGWGEATIVDDSFVDIGDGPQRMGGREPSLALDPATGEAWVAWHDHRHSNPLPPGNGIDNLEIYADRKQAGGAFSPADIRLTTTAAGTNGDNGYSPSIVALPGGGVAVAWNDFHFNPVVSDIFLRVSDAAGAFSPADPVPGVRLTDGSARTGALANWSFADVEARGDGSLGVLWTAGTGGAAPVYFALVPTPPGLVAEQVIAEATAGFFDPPRLVGAPSGDLWAVYTKRVGTDRDIEARRLPAGSSTWDAPRTLVGGGARQEHPHLAVNGEGQLVLVHIDETDGRHVRLAVLDASGTELASEIVTDAAGPWQRPVVALDATGKPFVAWEEDTGGDAAGDIWARIPARDASAGTTEWEAMRW